MRASLAALIAATGFAPHALAQDQKAGEKAAKAEQSKNSTMERADRDMRAVLEQLQQLGAKPIATLSVEEARKQPSPADAVKAVMEKRGKETASANVKIENVTYPGSSGEQPARVYIPEAKGQKGQGQQGLPVIVYYHGGGWVIADLDTYEASAQALAKKVNAIVVWVEYRHAHEFFVMAPVVRDAERAQDFAARELRDAFESPRAATGAGQGSAGKDRAGERDSDKRK